MKTTPDHPHIWYDSDEKVWMCGIKGYYRGYRTSAAGLTPKHAFLVWGNSIRNLRASGMYYEVFP